MQRELVDTAFQNSIRKVKKVSYDKTIDVQFGIYEGGEFDGWLTINLKPSKGWLDWLINLVAGAQKTAHGRVHKGYWKEIDKYWDNGGNKFPLAVLYGSANVGFYEGTGHLQLQIESSNSSVNVDYIY